MNIKTTLCITALVVLFGITGAMDYNDELQQQERIANGK